MNKLVKKLILQINFYNFYYNIMKKISKTYLKCEKT